MLVSVKALPILFLLVCFGSIRSHYVPSVFARAGGAGPASDDYLVTKVVDMEICSAGNEFPCGNIKIGLFGDTVPKTVANFVALADNEVLIFVKS